MATAGSDRAGCGRSPSWAVVQPGGEAACPIIRGAGAAAAAFGLVVRLVDCAPPLPATAPAGADELIDLASLIDGDTVEVRGERVRRHGIDAPESAQRCEGTARRISAAGPPPSCAGDEIADGAVGNGERRPIAPIAGFAGGGAGAFMRITTSPHHRQNRERFSAGRSARRIRILGCNWGAKPAEISGGASTAASAGGGIPRLPAIRISLTS